jgi:hypothetical protein
LKANLVAVAGIDAKARFPELRLHPSTARRLQSNNLGALEN